MRIFSLAVCLTVVAASIVSLAGCGSNSAEPPTTQIDGTPPPLLETDSSGHEGHDHGDDASDGHPTEGPHGGHLIELGNEEYHAELLHDENTHRVTIHLLDSAGKTPVAVPLEEVSLQLFRAGQFEKYTLTAALGQGSAAGGVSQFEIVNAALCDALCDEDELRGQLQITINGKPYTGTIEGGGHEGHDHDGDDDGAHDGDGHDPDEPGHEGHNH